MKNPLTTAFPQRMRTRLNSPMQVFKDMENEMERWFGQSPFTSNWSNEIDGFEFSPDCNIRESDNSYILQFDIPGIKKEDVKIEIESNRLTVSGERKKRKKEKDEKRFLSESYYGTFMRSFTLPSAIDENKVDAQYEDGVLTVKIPKIETSRSREVKVH